ncbi:hypothetical protein [Rhodoferax sp. WC2427]|uniref:hypothetical protein n=1 Tax=Rhodoferax sp. WC2427 TaxID=3234144 RepID=UPI0034659FE5
MEKAVLVIIGAIFLLALLYWAFKLGKKRVAVTKPELDAVSTTLVNVQPFTSHIRSALANFELLDDQGKVMIASRELECMPNSGAELKPTAETGKLITRLASEFFKGAVSIPGKTVEIVFHPRVQEGLRDGTFSLMQTRTGEVLADAVNNASGRIVGKGRIVQTGQVKQLAAGAFQLASIVVAQSHLADIERSLSALKGGINQVLDNMEASDVASIKGGIAYLEQVADLIKSNGVPDQLSMPLQVTIAQLVLSSNVWREKLFEDVRSLIHRIGGQQDQDSWGGTENTYKALLSHADVTDKLAKRYDLYTDFVRLLDFLLIYIDPLKKNFVPPQVDGAQWEGLLSNLRDGLAAKTDELIKAIFNSDEILQARKDKINLKMDKFVEIGVGQLRAYEAFSLNLSQRLDLILSASDGVKLAIAFDDDGEVKRASLQ